MYLKSAILNKMQKELLKDALLAYVSNLQKLYSGDKNIDESLYLSKMKEIQNIVDELHLQELYVP